MEKRNSTAGKRVPATRSIVQYSRPKYDRHYENSTTTLLYPSICVLKIENKLLQCPEMMMSNTTIATERFSKLS